MFDKELLRLDRLVWKLRQYAQPLDVVHFADPPSPQARLANIARIEAGMSGPAQSGRVPAGMLEQILADKKHASREALIWANAWYCVKPRMRVRVGQGFVGVNAPLWLHPELAGKVAQWMQIPKEALDGARQLVDRRKRTGERP